tara:strand:- start:944 stop:1195 length:252 start_codon:yes stop_codon:yes gene_type:complete
MNKTNAEKAFDELTAMGVPVVEFSHYSGYFQLSAEEQNSSMWVDYYNHDLGDFGISDKIHAVLDKHGLFAEWENAAIAVVWDE